MKNAEKPMLLRNLLLMTASLFVALLFPRVICRGEEMTRGFATAGLEESRFQVSLSFLAHNNIHVS